MRAETYIAQANVLDKLRIQLRLRNNLLQQLDDEAIERRVLEASFVCLRKRRSDSERNDDIIRIFRRTRIHSLAMRLYPTILPPFHRHRTSSS